MCFARAASVAPLLRTHAKLGRKKGCRFRVSEPSKRIIFRSLFREEGAPIYLFPAWEQNRFLFSASKQIFYSLRTHLFIVFFKHLIWISKIQITKTWKPQCENLFAHWEWIFIPNTWTKILFIDIFFFSFFIYLHLIWISKI